jgi:hypothetical protein
MCSLRRATPDGFFRVAVRVIIFRILVIGGDRLW